MTNPHQSILAVAILCTSTFLPIPGASSDREHSFFSTVSAATMAAHDTPLLVEYIRQTWQRGPGVWVNSSRFSYDYDSAGRKIADYMWNYRTDKGDWEGFLRETYRYDPVRNTVAESIESNMDTATGQWKPPYRRNAYARYEIASESMVEESLQTPFPQTGGWLTFEYDQRVYNADGRLLRQAQRNRIRPFPQDYISLLTYAYDAEGHELKSTYQGYNSSYGTFDTVQSTVREYNSAGLCTAFVTRQFTMGSSGRASPTDWYSCFYEYDGAGRQVSTGYRDSTAEGTGQLYSRSWMTYQPNNTISQTLTAIWRVPFTDPPDARRDTGWSRNLYTYDASLRPLEDLRQSLPWRDPLAVWQDYQRTVNTYDEYGNLLSYTKAVRDGTHLYDESRILYTWTRVPATSIGRSRAVQAQLTDRAPRYAVLLVDGSAPTRKMPPARAVYSLTGRRVDASPARGRTTTTSPSGVYLQVR
jgi:hypothetical protein